MNIIPSFKYRLTEFLHGSLYFLVIFALIMAGLSVSVSGSTVIGGYEISACIYVFVMGIISIREDLRLGIQNGVGRRSVFFASLFSTALAALVLAAVIELFITVSQALTKNLDNILISSLYEILSSPQASLVGEPLPAALGVHLAGILLSFVLMMGASLFGSFISLVFYRLNKRWTVIVAAGVPLLLFWALPLTLSYFGLDFGVLFEKFAFTAFNVTVLCAACAALIAAFNYLLIWRAPIRTR